MPPKTVALVAAVCITIGWLLASTIAPPVARVQSLSARQPSPAAEPLPRFAEQLHERLRRVPDPPSNRRNPFSFGEPEGRESAAVAIGEHRHDAAVPSPTSVPRGPVYFLAGLGISADGRTAVLTDGQVARIVNVSDVVDGYTVVEITDDAVTLAGSSGERHVLRLR